VTKYTNDDLNKALHSVGLDRDNRRTFVQKVSSLIKEWETTADHPNDKKRHPVTDWHLKQVKQQLEGLVISERDKNTAQLFVE